MIYIIDDYITTDIILDWLLYIDTELVNYSLLLNITWYYLNYYYLLILTELSKLLLNWLIDWTYCAFYFFGGFFGGGLGGEQTNETLLD